MQWPRAVAWACRDVHTLHCSLEGTLQGIPAAALASGGNSAELGHREKSEQDGASVNGVCSLGTPGFGFSLQIHFLWSPTFSGLCWTVAACLCSICTSSSSGLLLSAIPNPHYCQLCHPKSPLFPVSQLSVSALGFMGSPGIPKQPLCSGCSQSTGPTSQCSQCSQCPAGVACRAVRICRAFPSSHFSIPQSVLAERKL